MDLQPSAVEGLQVIIDEMHLLKVWHFWFEVGHWLLYFVYASNTKLDGQGGGRCSWARCEQRKKV